MRRDHTGDIPVVVRYREVRPAPLRTARHASGLEEEMRRRIALMLASVLVVGACGGSSTPVPSASPSVGPSPSDVFASEQPSGSPAASPVVASPSPDQSSEPTVPASGTTYTVKKNDTMWAIAQKFGVSLHKLKAANPKVVPTSMKIGTVLIIPPK